LDNSIIFVSHAGILENDLSAELGTVIVGKLKGTLWEQVDLRRYLILNHKPLLINFCNTGLLFYKRQVVTIHDMSYKVNPKWFSKKFYRWYNFMIPHIAAGSEKIFTVSNSSKNDITGYLNVNPDKVSVIYNSYYLITNDNFGRVNNEKYVLTVSSLNPRKNLDNLIKAFKQIDKKIRLIIVGLKNNNFGNVVNSNLLDSNIDVKGYVSDSELVSLMKNAEALVYMSFYEGFGLPPLEAMSYGCPVVVSDIAAHREVCGDAALYANPYSVDDIKDKIIEVLDNEKLKNGLIVAANKNIKRFNWFDSANEVLKNINEIVEKYK
jgi:glycosyltransferase involved in cell wall biosynthesis